MGEYLGEGEKTARKTYVEYIVTVRRSICHNLLWRLAQVLLVERNRVIRRVVPRERAN